MRFGLRLFGIPAIFIAAALFLAPIAARFEESPYLVGLADYARYACWLLAVAAVCSVGYNLFRVWRASIGKDDKSCLHCNMPTSHKEGRYGPYFRCWNCGTNRADR
jgi:hypothetical protein